MLWRMADRPPAGTPTASRQFHCSACGASAAVVALFLTDGRGRVARSCFTSDLRMPLSAAGYALVLQALLDGDAAALYQCDRELASFYCPDCGKSYCGAHWHRWDVFDDDGWHDSIRGTCPAGHERMLED